MISCVCVGVWVRVARGEEAAVMCCGWRHQDSSVWIKQEVREVCVLVTSQAPGMISDRKCVKSPCLSGVGRKQEQDTGWERSGRSEMRCWLVV